MPAKSILFAALALAVSGSPSLADPSRKPANQLKICRGPDHALGSRIKRSTRCRTIEQWREEDEAAVNVPATLRVVGAEKSPSSKPQ